METATRARMSTETVERRCAAIAERQHGLLTREQALAAGLSNGSLGRRLASGRLLRLHPSVFRVAGSTQSHEQRLLAACLWSGGVASHRTAAWLWKLDETEPSSVEITSPRRVRSQKVKLYRGHVPVSQVTKVGAIPVTTVPRTLLDLGSVASASTVEAAVTDALRRRRTTLVRLQRCLDEAGRKGRPGASVLRSILRTLGQQPAESVLELKLVRLLRRHGLPEPVRQFDIRKGQSLVARVDFAYPQLRLAIEADGFSFHSGPGSWTRDLARGNALTALGWHVVRVTERDLNERPKQAVEQLRQVVRVLSQSA